jgi:hypothetical protein
MVLEDLLLVDEKLWYLRALAWVSVIYHLLDVGHLQAIHHLVVEWVRHHYLLHPHFVFVLRYSYHQSEKQLL